LVAEPLDPIEEVLVLLDPCHQLMGGSFIARGLERYDVADSRLIEEGELTIGPETGARLRKKGSWLHHWGAPWRSIPSVAPAEDPVSHGPVRSKRRTGVVDGPDAGLA
jgi:hypothetical protein